jgi:hypothetical protein
LQRIHHNPELKPNDPATWPAMLRIRDICKRRGYDGILPITSSAFRDAIARGHIEPPIQFGARVNCWPKDYILRIQQRGLPRRNEKSSAEAFEHRRTAAGGG